jgi:hypothetical protein
MPKEAKVRAPREAPPVYWVAAEALAYISPRTGKWVKRKQREIIDDLPATSTINGRVGPNWTIKDRLVLAYDGPLTPGHILPRVDAEALYGGPLPGVPTPDAPEPPAEPAAPTEAKD